MNKMKTYVITVFILLLSFELSDYEVPRVDLIQNDVNEWDILIQAIIQVESEGDPFAVGKTNDVGILQITPIYVKEVNRILKRNAYTLKDRMYEQKSLEMFEVYQRHHNPDKNLLKAIKLHNPGAGKWYADKVIKMFNELNHREWQRNNTNTTWSCEKMHSN